MTALVLAQSIWSDPEFRSLVNSITMQSAARDIETLAPEAVALTTSFDWFHLLRCASVFVSDTTEQFHETGLRILHACLNSDAALKEKALASALLAKIASNPTIKLAESRGLVPANILDGLPFDLAMDVAAHQIASTINIGSSQEFVGNDFQNRLWHALLKHDWISASAPTAAGKSYILEKWIEHCVQSDKVSTTFFIVPTRALISQVETDLRSMLRHLAGVVSITSLPLVFAAEKQHNIYIYTQERFHLYLLNNQQLMDADLIIIDEAQKIGADRRGILLQQVIEMAASKYPDAKFLFASPSTENPESLLTFAPPDKRTTSVSGVKATVNQNLLWVEQTPRKPKAWNVSLLIDGEPQKIGAVELHDRPTTSQKLPFIANALAGNTPGNVIYVNRASDAEKIAEILCQFVSADEQDDELDALSEFCEKAVHPKFMLRRFVRKGVAFHYGNIPQLIRTEVERLFSAGKIKYLVCTSTLVEGVNLSCRNIFMRNPKRGMRELMPLDDFWNLAGRAGRWGKEFQGNIYCLDPQKSNEWIGGSAPRYKRKHRIAVASQRMSAEYDEFLMYIQRSRDGEAPKHRFHEQLMSYLIFRWDEFGDLGGTTTLGSLSTAQMEGLSREIEAVIKDLKFPIDLVKRNPGINPYGMSALLDYFMGKSPDDFESLIPADPLSDAPIESEEDGRVFRDAAIDNFISIFSRITSYLGGSLGEGDSAYGNALLVVHWMRGYPLSRIIEGQIRYWSRRDSGRDATAVIRETMERVEKIARFETPKYLHCYTDILSHFFALKGHTHAAEKMDEFWLYLEFGVSKRTQLSLMSLGLSRSSVTSLSDYITDDSLSEENCLLWLESNNWTEFGLPRLAQLEIHTVMAQHGRNALPPNEQSIFD